MGSSRSKIRVFVVEDHPSTARALKVFLNLRRCEVALASSMNSALELAPTIEYDVLV
jgi:DNA-binding response OmpR family regulator